MSVSGVSQRPDALLQESGSMRRETQATERPVRQERVEKESKPAEPKKVEAPEAPKPVVNMQGQTTGTRVNTSA